MIKAACDVCDDDIVGDVKAEAEKERERGDRLLTLSLSFVLLLIKTQAKTNGVVHEAATIQVEIDHRLSVCVC